MNRMLPKLWLLLILCGMMQIPSVAQLQTGKRLDLQGHRGARGLMPENTIPAMLKAIDLGVTTLEMDVVISRDGQVVLSHDAYFHHLITTTPAGNTVTQKEGEALLLYQMDYDSISRYDVGIKPHPLYPQQQKMRVYKPLLANLIDSAEAYAKAKGRTIRYNIEIKSSAGSDKVRHPEPARFAELLVAVLRSKGITDRTTIQSFDVRPLQYLHQKHPEIQLSYLVENTSVPLVAQIEKLGFVPHVYSPYYKMLRKETVVEAQKQGMQVIPWTINKLDEMKALVDMGVDGIISDYPDLFAQL